LGREPRHGFSYGYNRAEHIEHYHSGRELVLMLVDIITATVAAIGNGATE